ncbi:MAG: DUF4177 domain-containing protein [Chloroflexi bacterium]|nr:DUF4177 domain-containing protein [Chloroflexota bacterium]
MTEITRWEYRVKTIGSVLRGAKDEETEATLNEWGEDGWEVISARPPTNSSKMTIVAKRPLTTATQRQRRLTQHRW